MVKIQLASNLTIIITINFSGVFFFLWPMCCFVFLLKDNKQTWHLSMLHNSQSGTSTKGLRMEKKKAGAHQVINRNERIYMKGFLSYLHLGMKNFPNKIKMFNKKI